MPLRNALVPRAVAALAFGSMLNGNCLAGTTLSAPAPAGVFCDEHINMPDPQDVKANPVFLRPAVLQARAAQELCERKYAAALNDLAAAPQKTADGTKMVDYQRRYVVAQLFAGSPSKALALANSLGLSQKKDARTAFFDGKYCAAARSFALGAGLEEMSPDARDAFDKSGPPPELGAIAKAACATPAATVASLHVPRNTGDSLEELMLGNLAAQNRDWREAEIRWWNAAGDYPQMAVPEYIDMDAFGPDALVMLAYYYKHLPR